MDTGIALQLLNLLLSGGVLLYAIRVEHRFTRLETQQEIILVRLRLATE